MSMTISVGSTVMFSMYEVRLCIPEKKIDYHFRINILLKVELKNTNNHIHVR
jgi:hypothetical protein